MLGQIYLQDLHLENNDQLMYSPKRKLLTSAIIPFP